MDIAAEQTSKTPVTPPPLEWLRSEGLVDYAHALGAMESHVAEMIAGRAGERIWLLEHPPLYTAGTSAHIEDLTDPGRFPVYAAGRGGQYTYHGPGQRVAYTMLDLKRRKPDVRWLVSSLEEWVIRALADFNVKGERREGRVGIWVDRGQGREDKIAAIGIRIRRWVSFHGISVNVEPDLSHFSGIVPCGIAEPRFGVTSLVDLGLPVSMGDLDDALMRHFDAVFSPIAQQN